MQTNANLEDVTFSADSAWWWGANSDMQSAPIVITPQITPLEITPLQGNAAFCVKTNGAQLIPSRETICTATANIRNSFNNLIATTYAPGNTMARSNLFGQTLRVVFHDACEGDLTDPTNTMGVDGCLSDATFKSGSTFGMPFNSGLTEPSSLIMSVLEPIWQNNCDLISRADFWAFFAILVLKHSDPTGSLEIPFQFGRVDARSCYMSSTTVIPDAQFGLAMLQEVFIDQLGLTARDAVTLLGAHSLGHVHPERSGYGFSGDLSSLVMVNAWDDTPDVFDNKYYESMLARGWINQGVPTSPQTLSMWVGAAGSVMLNIDMILGADIALTTVNQCRHCGVPGQHCGPMTTLQRGIGMQALQSGPLSYGCERPDASTDNSVFFDTVAFFADPTQGNAAFLQTFATSFVAMTTVGYSMDGSVGRLGQVSSIQLHSCT